MLNKSFFLFVVLMSWGIHELVQTEMLPGPDIPIMNATWAVGQWYVVKGPGINDDIACVTLNIEPQSTNEVTLSVNITRMPEAIMKNRIMDNSPITAPWNCTIKEDSNIVTCNNSRVAAISIIIFDSVLDSYMSVHLTIGTAQETVDPYGLIFILGRQPTLPDGIIEKVKETNYYQLNSLRRQQLTSSHSDSCQ